MQDKLIFLGYFGRNNLGDDLILLGQYLLFRKYSPDTELMFWSKNKTNIHIDLRTDLQPIYSGKNLITQLRKSFLIIGGGGLFPSDSLLHIIKYYLLSKTAKNGYAFLGIGVNKFESKASKLIAKRLFLNSRGILTRDKLSFRNIQSLTGKNQQKIVSTKDIVLVFFSEIINYLNLEKKQESIKSNVAICPAAPVNYKDLCDCAERYALIVKELMKEYDEIVLIPFSEEYDRILCNMIRSRIASNNVIISSKDDNRGKLEMLMKSRLVVAQRYHSIILSIALNKKFIPIVYDYKSLEVLKQFNINDFLFMSYYMHSHLKERRMFELSSFKQFIKSNIALSRSYIGTKDNQSDIKIYEEFIRDLLI